MRRIFFIITLLSLILVSCEKTYNNDVYFYNDLDKNITLEVFKNEVKTNFELTPNDSIYFDSFRFSMNRHAKYIQFPGFAAYQSFVYDNIDSVNVLYNSKKYTYHQYDSIFGLFYPDSYWTIIFDEHKKQEFGWE